MILAFALWVSLFGPAPALAAEPQAANPPPDASAASQRYRAINLRMTKKEVHRLMGNPSQSTDTLWLYTYPDGTIVEVTFSKQRRVIEVVNYKKPPKR